MNSRFDTPLLFLIFNRPDTTQMVFNQVKKLKPRYLFVAADGPRDWVAGEKEKCEETRKIISQVYWDCKLQTLFRDANIGVAKAVSSAITWFFNHVPEGIILEDDGYPDESFFAYCSELLSKYRHVDEVKLISGNNFQNGIVRGGSSYYFSHYPEIWGWASWRRVWNEYDFEMRDMEKTLAEGNLLTVFKTNSERTYWQEKFLQTKKGNTNTWDYQLTYSILKNNGLAITPQVNLVKNIGINNNATHLSLKDSAKDVPIESMKFPLVHPQVIQANDAADRYSFLRIYGKSFPRLVRLLKENGVKKCFAYTLNKLFKRKFVVLV